jgi:hypothetical protein
VPCDCSPRVRAPISGTKFLQAKQSARPNNLYSDGVIEAQSPSGEVFGFERFENLRTCAGKSADGTRDTVLEAWKDFVARDCPEDDRTLLVLKIDP